MAEIRFVDEVAREFAGLEKRASQGDGDARVLLDSFNRGIAKLVADHRAGQQVSRKLWPRAYERKYRITNLWRLRLDRSWRLLYSLSGENVRIVAVVLEVLDHRDYDRRFGYG